MRQSRTAMLLVAVLALPIAAQAIHLLRERLVSFAVETVPGAGNFVFEEKPLAVVAAVERAAGSARLQAVARAHTAMAQPAAAPHAHTATAQPQIVEEHPHDRH